MKLSKLYSNKDKIFQPVIFKDGINVVIAESIQAEHQGTIVSEPKVEYEIEQEEEKRDTHNKGKSILAKLIDFCLLKEKNKDNIFLLSDKNYKLFQEFEFFLEIELIDCSYITVKRSVKKNTKISFKIHEEKADYTYLNDDEWTHSNIPIGTAKEILDGALDLKILKPWSYRKIIGYLLRDQDDFNDVFRLAKFRRKDIDWKPFLALMMGLDSSLLKKQYTLKESIEKNINDKKQLESDLSGLTDSLDKLIDLIKIKNNKISTLKKQISDFNFMIEDLGISKEIAEKLDTKISSLNKRLYYLDYHINKINESIKNNKVLFKPDEADSLFKEAGLYFEGQIKKSFDELIEFNKSITDERRRYLRAELREHMAEHKNISSELESLNDEREKMYSVLSETNLISKYKKITNTLVTKESELSVLMEKSEKLKKLNKIKKDIDKLTSDRRENSTKISDNVNDCIGNDESIFSKIKMNFDKIISNTIDRNALISTSQNKEGYLEFECGILDENKLTSEIDGHTYKKLLCMAFDLSLIKSYQGLNFPKFLYHDGAYQALNDNSKIIYTNYIRRFLGNEFQYIVTLIDSERPDGLYFENEVIVRLHDGGEDGRLFKMESW